MKKIAYTTTEARERRENLRERCISDAIGACGSNHPGNSAHNKRRHHMAKKAAKVSWRTLTRKADKARNPRTASRLRKQAHELRRAARAAVLKEVKVAPVPTKPTKRRNLSAAKRAAKGWATRRANMVAVAAQMPGAPILTSNTPWRATVMQQQVATDRGLPGQGELVGGVFSQLADKIAKLARKKGGSDDIQNELLALAAAKHYEGRVESDKVATKRLIEVQETISQRIVCGFIAEVDQAIQEHRGLPNSMTWVLNSYLITKIVDALNKAGYSASGMNDVGSAKGYDKESL